MRVGMPGLCMLILLTGRANSQDFFDDIEINTEDESKQETRFSSKGYLQQKIKYGMAQPEAEFPFERNRSGLDQVQSDMFFEFSGRLSPNLSLQASVKAEVDWLLWDNGEQHWKANHQRLLLRDAYLDINFDNGHWLRLGHQVFAWGESEGLVISDILAPNDLREFGQAQLRDLREQIPAVLWAMPGFDGTLNWVATWDAGQNRYASEDEAFYPYITFKDSGLSIDHLAVQNNWELALKYDRQFNGGDLSVVIAEVNDNQPAIHSIDQATAEIQLLQERIHIAAASVNRVKNAWLFKAELGRFWGPLVSDAGNLPQPNNQWRGMGGFEYSGWNNWRVNYELNFIYQDDVSASSSSRRNVGDLGHVARITYDALNQRLSQQLWLLRLLEDNGSVIRYDLSYEYSDNIELNAALVLYDNTEPLSQFYAFRQHDTLNVSITLSF